MSLLYPINIKEFTKKYWKLRSGLQDILKRNNQHYATYEHTYRPMTPLIRSGDRKCDKNMWPCKQILQAYMSGCLPNFKHGIPCLFSDFSLTFFYFSLNLRKHFLIFLSWNLLTKFKNLWNLSTFWYFSYNSLFSKEISLTSMTLYLNSLTFPRLFLG